MQHGAQGESYSPAFSMDRERMLVILVGVVTGEVSFLVRTLELPRDDMPLSPPDQAEVPPLPQMLGRSVSFYRFAISSQQALFA